MMMNLNTTLQRRPLTRVYNIEDSLNTALTS